MLYDKRWDDKSAHGVSLRGLIAWLETQPPDQPYDYGDPGKCVVAQYLGSIGSAKCMVCFGYEPERSPDAWLHYIAKGNGRYPQKQQTFGAALARARQYFEAA
jgi:hypothetical protein